MVIGRKKLKQVLKKASRSEAKTIVSFNNGTQVEGYLTRRQFGRGSSPGNGGWNYYFVQKGEMPITMRNISRINYDQYDNLTNLTIVLN